MEQKIQVCRKNTTLFQWKTLECRKIKRKIKKNRGKLQRKTCRRRLQDGKKIMRVTREIGQRVNRRNDLKKKQLENPAKNLKLETNGSDNNGTTTVTNDKETEQNVNRNLEKNEKNNTEETKEKSVKMLKNEKNQRQIGPREKHRIINEEHRIINTTNA